MGGSGEGLSGLVGRAAVLLALAPLAFAARAEDPSDAEGHDDPLRRALLDALAGGDAAKDAFADRIASRPGGAEWPLDGDESWLAADVLPPGPARGRAIVHALEQTAGALSQERLTVAYEAGVEAAEDLRLGEAIAIQRDVHGRAGAEWSAVNLSLSLRRAGDYDGADRVLEEQLERGGSADLLSQRGLNALAAGREAPARATLGAAVARGSLDAAVILARLDLARGRTEAARAGFRRLIAEEPPGAWAIRGWGVSLVETPGPAAGAPSPSVP